jgi:hypothetical protein
VKPPTVAVIGDRFLKPDRFVAGEPPLNPF